MDGVCWVFLFASIRPSRTWVSGSLESMQWNACVHRQDLGLCSHLKEFWGNGVRTHVNSKGKIPSTGKILKGSNPGRCFKQDSKSNILPKSYSGPESTHLHTLHNENRKQLFFTELSTLHFFFLCRKTLSLMQPKQLIWTILILQTQRYRSITSLKLEHYQYHIWT